MVEKSKDVRLTGVEASFDVIAVDGTDPVGPGTILFEEEFYRIAKAALKKGGAYVQQVESPFFALAKKPFYDLKLADIVARAKNVFSHVYLYWATIPTYFGSFWTFLYAGDEDLAKEPLDENWQSIAGQTKYYSPEIHRAAFVLPPFVNELLQYR
jgi:spermidine synthase